jgi:hypothetical protein
MSHTQTTHAPLPEDQQRPPPGGGHNLGTSGLKREEHLIMGPEETGCEQILVSSDSATVQWQALKNTAMNILIQ